MKFFIWHISKFCKYSCRYCYIPSEERTVEAQNLSQLDKIKLVLDSLEPSRFVLTGGEPLLQENFKELCEHITKRHWTCVCSSLSEPIEDILKAATFGNLHFSISLHVSERDINPVIERINQIQEAGFSYDLSQVLHPEVLPLFQSAQDLLCEKRILLMPRLFEGIYQGKKYPFSYSLEERKLLLEFTHGGENTKVRAMLEAFKTEDTPSFKGKLCASGVDYFRIYEDGKIRRCSQGSSIFGNIVTGDFSPFTSNKKCSLDRLPGCFTYTCLDMLC